MRRPEKKRRKDRFAATCQALIAAGGPLGISASIEKATAAKGRRVNPIGRPERREASDRAFSERMEDLGTSLKLADIHIAPEHVLAAGKSLFAILTLSLAASAAIAFFVLGAGCCLLICACALTVPYISKSALMTQPSRKAASRASKVLRSSSEPVNLMIMSLRHEPSVSKAIAFASGRSAEFSAELKACTWGVIMGRFASFEDSLIDLGQKWSRYGSDLKASLNALVTASRESTQEGKRRALDRANSSLISGAKRRIEDYSASLAAPTMMLFGLGILLPLMVGSFLPMLSWNLWSADGLAGGQTGLSQGQTTAEMVFVMNVLLPAVAALIAMSALSGYPFEPDAHRETLSWPGPWYGPVLAATATVAGSAAGACYLAGAFRPVELLLSAVVPLALWLILTGKGKARNPEDGVSGLEDALFKTGARMLEGENFETSLNRSSRDLGRRTSDIVKRLSLRTTIMGQDDLAAPSDHFGSSNAIGGLRIAKLAARKDERAAGMLAMDLAAYLKDLRDLEATLKNRLRPTISMMRMTALVLAPIVLGVTYAIYLSLASMIGGGEGVGAEQIFLVLGVFLAEMDIVVFYFIWGIDGRRDAGALKSSVGSCMLISEAVYASTALLASM
jgi:hypothetical protein